VAVKTGTTNEYRDAWVIGYTPDIVVAAWSGNNDNSSMEKRVAGFIVAPMWNEFMQEAFKHGKGDNRFTPASPIPYSTLKPVLRGVWQGNQSYVVDKMTGNLATDNTPPELREERFVPNIHDILYWVDKDNPRGPMPKNPASDPQFQLWEYGVALWSGNNSGLIASTTTNTPPTATDDVHKPENAPKVTIKNPNDGDRVDRSDRVHIRIDTDSKFDIKRADFFINEKLVGTVGSDPFSFTFVPDDTDAAQRGENTLRVIVYDEKLNRGEASVKFEVR
jgi:membrane peptidoglycan carboxypeptidase